MKTKKTLKIVCLCIFTVLFLFAYAQARITGNVCSNCHTMHNSQNATSMRLDIIGAGTPPNTRIIGSGMGECQDCHSKTRAVLLRLDCIGCHAKEFATNTNITTDGWPQIALNVGATALAGGNYKFVCGDDELGHNVHGFGFCGIGSDSLMVSTTPPGYDSSYDPSSGGYGSGNAQQQVMCAGQFGCHGNRDTSIPYIAMKRTHHANDSMLKFGTINETQQGGGLGVADTIAAGKSYRFLYNVHGGEDSDWQASVSATDHNEYKGAAFDAGRTLGGGQSWGDIETISQLCAECHGYFHASDEITNTSGTPWKRHPTDAVLPNSGEYSAYTAYSTQAPVARPVINNSSPSSVVVPGDTATFQGAIVMCLSCHRAHASAFRDALRWDYDTMVAGGGGSGGCFTCHTTKDTSP